MTIRLFAVTVFLSSFLLFQVQPLLGKYLLPLFGGSASVWVTAMFFFMFVLFLGYLYALWLVKHPLVRQVIIHSLLLLLCVGLLFEHNTLWLSPITPEFSDFKTTDVLVFDIILILFTSIGLPFFVLSATSTLIQVWYEKITKVEPFRLYSVSNVGSLLGLLSYPIIFEPILTIGEQGKLWSYGFLFYIGLMYAVLWEYWQNGERVTRKLVEDNNFTLTKKTFLGWATAASLPVIVLLSGTTYMSTTIAPIPFLWVGPLTLYLLSFIISFNSRWHTPSWFNEKIVLVFSFGMLVIGVVNQIHVVATIMVTHLALFSIFHWCHEYLYRTRPPSSNLASFYLALSVGGILGSLFVVVSTATVFVVPVELILILSLIIVYICFVWFRSPDGYLPILSKRFIRYFSPVFTLLVILFSTTKMVGLIEGNIAAERNFFGDKAVKEVSVDNDTLIRNLRHGTTNHGAQIIESGVATVTPISYYSGSSGVGKTFQYLQSNNSTLEVAVMGLGSGSLASYCRQGDEFTFFEIDPEVIDLANKYFTFLQSCPQVQVVNKDARLALTELDTQGRKFDLLIMDAYADDLPPIHLLTKEAMALYKNLLSEKGVIAIHISSRYLDLLPVIRSGAKSNGLYMSSYFDSTSDRFVAATSWVLLTPDEAVLDQEEFVNFTRTKSEDKLVNWSDGHSALYSVLKW